MQLGLVEEKPKTRQGIRKNPEEREVPGECPGGLDSEMWIQMNDEGEEISVGFCRWALLPFFRQDITILRENKMFPFLNTLV